MRKKSTQAFVAFSLALPLTFSFPILAYADSGYSALPPQDSAMHQRYYQMYAPKTQTTFKQFGVVTRNVDSIMKQNESLLFYGGNIMAGSTIATALAAPTAKNPYVSAGIAIVGGVGGAMYLMGSFGKASYENFKKGSVLKTVVYFKWTNAARLEYATMTQSWVEYNGIRVSEVKTGQYSKTL